MDFCNEYEGNNVSTLKMTRQAHGKGAQEMGQPIVVVDANISRVLLRCLVTNKLKVYLCSNRKASRPVLTRAPLASLHHGYLQSLGTSVLIFESLKQVLTLALGNKQSWGARLSAKFCRYIDLTPSS